MKQNNHVPSYATIMLSTFLLLSILSSHEVKADKAYSDIGSQIAGTYLLTEDDNGGSRIVTIAEDGGWFGIHSFQRSNNFSNQQGSWEQIEKRKITAKTLNFSHLKEGIGSSRFTFTAEFDQPYEHINGSFSGKVFSPGVDPLDPVAAPIKTFSNTFTGRRLIVTENAR
ncbi:MAG: hypothetical protein GY941_02660 [Planctomycetes bacterium]|nr:hypothetical protein [Planctomycetota bacterium]